MFDLDHAIDQWCRNAPKELRIRSIDRDELRDHLYCAVDRLVADGVSEEEAFAAAVADLGDTSHLAQEYRKNHSSLIQRFVALECKLGRFENGIAARLGRLGGRRIAALQIALSLLFAGAIVLCSYLLGDSSYQDAVTYSLIAAWWVPFTLLLTATQEKRCGDSATSIAE